MGKRRVAEAKIILKRVLWRIGGKVVTELK